MEMESESGPRVCGGHQSAIAVRYAVDRIPVSPREGSPFGSRIPSPPDSRMQTKSKQLDVQPSRSSSHNVDVDTPLFVRLKDDMLHRETNNGLMGGALFLDSGPL